MTRTALLPAIVPALLAGLAACGGPGSTRIQLASGARGNPGAVETEASVLKVAPQPVHTVAVLHFANDTGDPGLDWLQRGLTDMLVTDLGQSARLKVLTPARLDEILAGNGKSTASLAGDPLTAARLARDASVETVVTGRYFRDRDDLVIETELRDAASGRSLRKEAARGPGLDRIFVMVGDLSRRLRDGLRGDLREAAGGEPIETAGGEAKAAAGAGALTESVTAFRHYSNGLAAMDRVIMADADREFELAIAEDPQFAAAHLQLVHVKDSLGEADAARAALAQARRFSARLSGTDQVVLRLREAEAAGDIELVRAVLDELREKAPHDLDARTQVAGDLWRFRELERARDEYERIREEDPGRKTVWNDLAYLYAERGDFRTAFQYLEHYRDMTPGEPNAYDSIGEILERSGRLEDAAEQFKLALGRFPQFFNSARRLSEIYAELGDAPRAIEYADRWLASAPGPVEKARAHMGRGLVLWRFGRPAEAAEELQLARALAADPIEAAWLEAQLRDDVGDAPAARRIRGECVARNGGFRGAMPVYEVALFFDGCLEPDLPPDEALRTLEAIGATQKEQVQSVSDLLQIYRAVVLLRAGDTARAAESLASRGSLDHLVSAGRYLRSTVWKHLVEAVQLEPRTEPRSFPLADRMRDAARQAGRKDVAVLARLLEAQYQDKYGDANAMRATYRALGVPLEESFRVVGPFDGRDGFRRVYPPETGVDLAARYPHEGCEATWRPAADGVHDGWVDLRKIYGRARWSVAYAAVDVTSPEERIVQVRLGSDESLKLWLNGEPVWQTWRHEETPADHDIVTVVLRPGENRLLVKSLNSLGDWGFYLRVTDDKGEGFPDLEFHPPAPPRTAGASAPAAPPPG